jgi:predicted O-methyltransferase YrrM
MLLALSRDTRAFINTGPDGKSVDDWFDVRAHGPILYALARNINWPDPRAPRPLRPPLCLEIGVRHGVSTLNLLHAMREANGRLVSLECDPDWARAAADVIERAQLTPWWDLRIQRSDDFDCATLGRPLDFLLIDGDHGLDQVRKDVERFVPQVRPGGLIALHDYYSKPWPCDPPIQPPFPSYVSAAVEQLRQTGCYEILTLPFSFGLTLVRVLSPAFEPDDRIVEL